MNRFIAYAASVALLLLSLPSKADSVIAEYTPSLNDVHYAEGDNLLLGATFTPTDNGTVQTVSALLVGYAPIPSPPSINFAITATAGGLPTTTLAATDMLSPALTGTPAITTADFSFAGLNLHAGELYAIVLRAPNMPGYPYSFAWSGDNFGSYAGGQAVRSFDAGANWSVLPAAFGFSVTAKFVVPEPSTFVYCGLISLLAGVCGCRVRRRLSVASLPYANSH